MRKKKRAQAFPNSHSVACSRACSLAHQQCPKIQEDRVLEYVAGGGGAVWTQPAGRCVRRAGLEGVVEIQVSAKGLQGQPGGG